MTHSSAPIIALVRAVSDAIADCQLTHIERVSIDVERARAQHTRYVATLQTLGCSVIELPPLHDCPDAVFVEDTAIVLPELAIITRPGAVSRQAETASVASVLGEYRPLATVSGASATLDGGDVVVDGKAIYVGLSARSNQAAIEQLAKATAPFGYRVKGVPLRHCLHLKTAVTRIADATFVGNPDWYDAEAMPGQHLHISPDEPFAGNTVQLGGSLLRAAEFPRTNAQLKQAGYDVHTVPADELARAEGAVTCCSLLISPPC